MKVLTHHDAKSPNGVFSLPRIWTQERMSSHSSPGHLLMSSADAVSDPHKIGIGAASAALGARLHPLLLIRIVVAQQPSCVVDNVKLLPERLSNRRSGH